MGIDCLVLNNLLFRKYNNLTSFRMGNKKK